MRLPGRNKSGMLFLDLVTSLTIIWFLIWIFGGIIGTLAKNSKETALRYQLSNLRMMLMLYKELKGQYPQNLKELMATDYRVFKADKPISSELFLVDLRKDANGNLADAFGNQLNYDLKKGVVWSQTKGYENW